MERTVAPTNIYDAEAWAQFAADEHARLVEVARQQSIINYLGLLKTWNDNVAIYQALGVPVPVLPVPPDGYTAPVTPPTHVPNVSENPIGALTSDGPNIYFGDPRDMSPAGTLFPRNVAPGQAQFVKTEMRQTPFGWSMRWLKIQ